VSEHLTEEQQVEAIKGWWKENGISVILGLLIGFGALFGWNYWKDYRDDRAAEASAVYQQLLTDLQANKTDAARGQAEILVNDYSATPYATMAAFSLAKTALEANDIASAKTRLRWVLDNSHQEQFMHTARLRLARVLISNNEADAADTLIKDVKVDAYIAPYAELRGDIAMLRGDRETARTAYMTALEASVDNNNQRTAIQNKLDDVAAGEAK
jgi:predicted negative regulator of RcsB-dependent stress response